MYHQILLKVLIPYRRKLNERRKKTGKYGMNPRPIFRKRLLQAYHSPMLSCKGSKEKQRK
jgi:hypothetical protein